MKATGIVRRVDDLGRLVIPKELRKTMNVESGEPLEIYVDDGGEIILKKYHPGCVFCGEIGNVQEFEGEFVCENCIESLQEHKS